MSNSMVDSLISSAHRRSNRTAVGALTLKVCSCVVHASQYGRHVPCRRSSRWLPTARLRAAPVARHASHPSAIAFPGKRRDSPSPARPPPRNDGGRAATRPRTCVMNDGGPRSKAGASASGCSTRGARWLPVHLGDGFSPKASLCRRLGGSGGGRRPLRGQLPDLLVEEVDAFAVKTDDLDLVHDTLKQRLFLVLLGDVPLQELEG